MITNQFKTPLFDALKKYQEKNVIPFDVPGHKHGKGLQEFCDYLGERVMEVDVNSMKCLDNLSNPTGVIEEAQMLMAEAYSSDHSFFLVNGTTSGIQAMIMSACNPGDKIILPRNAHKSAVNGIIMSGAIPVYMQPEIDYELGVAKGVSMEEVEKAIASNYDAKAIFIINPTYYGMTSDIKSIVKLAHRHGMAVLLDEAHGAHMNFHSELPISGMSVGADMAAVSVHKTGGSLTQSSALLLNEGFIEKSRVKNILNLTQTTSASYLLMSSLDVARKMLVTEGEEVFSRVLSIARDARKKINSIEGMYAFGKELVGESGVYDFDETKLGINVSGIGLTGFEVYDILRDEYNIQMELADSYNVLAILSVGDTENSVKALVEALKDIADKYSKGKLKYEKKTLQNPEVIVSPRNAFYAQKKFIDLKEAEGEISGESVMAYPPGIPIVTPGERITKEMIDHIEFLKSQGSLITDTQDPKVEKIKVLGF